MSQANVLTGLELPEGRPIIAKGFSPGPEGRHYGRAFARIERREEASTPFLRPLRDEVC
ncbi:MAG TPA: hypothetical protein VFJ58_20435 [Armatimonadota bacterium]|nr:hypothetical protein [Armatimonadota bacterium]